MKKRHLLIVPTIVVLLMGFGQCDRYRKAGELARDFALGVQAFQETEIVLHQQGKISDDEHRQIQQIILEVAADGQKLDRAIATTHSAPDAKTALDSAIAQLQGALADGVLHVKNPEVKAQLQTSLVLLRSILSNIQAIGG